MKKTKERQPNTTPGAPSKLTENFIKAAKKVIDEDMNAIILTDEELLLLINEELQKEERISKATFENWKANASKPKFKKDEYSERCQVFLRLIKKALTIQKQNLFEKLGESSAWQKYAWIIERKFDDWNIKHKTESEDPGTKAEVEKLRKDLKSIISKKK